MPTSLSSTRGCSQIKKCSMNKAKQGTSVMWLTACMIGMNVRRHNFCFGTNCKIPLVGIQHWHN